MLNYVIRPRIYAILCTKILNLAINLQNAGINIHYFVTIVDVLL